MTKVLARGEGKRGLFAFAAVAVVSLAMLVVLAPSLYEVVAKGDGPPVVPYEAGEVYKIRLLDLFTFYAAEEARPEPDKLSSVVLVGAATMALMAWLLLRMVLAGARERRFFGFASAGLAFLAADELFGVHETIGHNLQFLADIPGVERPDDVVFALLVVPLAFFAWSFRDILFKYRRAVQLFAVGTFLFLLAVVGDLSGSHLDEPIEVISAACLLAGLVTITTVTLRRELHLDALVVSRRMQPAPDGSRSERGGAGGPATPVASAAASRSTNLT